MAEKKERWKVSYFSCILLICNVIWSLWTRCRVSSTNIANYSENCYYLILLPVFLLLFLFMSMCLTTCCIFIKCFCFAVYSNEFVFATNLVTQPLVSRMNPYSHRHRQTTLLNWWIEPNVKKQKAKERWWERNQQQQQRKNVLTEKCMLL